MSGASLLHGKAKYAVTATGKVPARIKPSLCFMMMMMMMMLATKYHRHPTSRVTQAFSGTTTIIATRRLYSHRHFALPLPPLRQQQQRPRAVLRHQGDDEHSDHAIAATSSLEDHVVDDTKKYNNNQNDDDDDGDNANHPVASVAVLNALVPRFKITPLIQSKSNLQGTLQVTFHLGMFALVAAVVPPSLLIVFSQQQPQVVAMISILAMAFVSSFFFHGLHETVHGTAFSSRWANHVASHVFGLLCLRPARHYYYYHWQHHRYTGNVQLDSELAVPSSLLDFPVNNISGYLLYLSGLPFWMDAIFNNLIRHAAGKCPEMYLATDQARRQVVIEARVYLALYTLIGTIAAMFGTMTRNRLLHYWILPALLGQPFLRFYLLAEHRGRKTSPLVYENTRTMQNIPWIYRKLAWNMPFHMEHHAWPSIPFHQLRRAHELLTSQAAAAIQDAANDVDAENTKKAAATNLFEQGEVHADFVGCGNQGYIAFNWKFFKRLLFQQEKS